MFNVNAYLIQNVKARGLDIEYDEYVFSLECKRELNIKCKYVFNLECKEELNVECESVFNLDHFWVLDVE